MLVAVQKKTEDSPWDPEPFRTNNFAKWGRIFFLALNHSINPLQRDPLKDTRIFVVKGVNIKLYMTITKQK